MKRENEVPAGLIAYIEKSKKQMDNRFNESKVYCTFPVRCVKMKLLKEHSQGFENVIIPAVEVRAERNPTLKAGFLRQDALTYFVAGTRKAFPYGHVYHGSGHICLGNIFVPSAVPEFSPAMPLETLFLHNDRNLSHGDARLSIDRAQADAIKKIMEDNVIKLSTVAKTVIDKPGAELLRRDEIWHLSKCVVSQKSLLDAFHIMEEVYDVIFRRDIEQAKKELEKAAESEGN